MCHQGNLRRLIECFQAAHDGQQFETLTRVPFFFVLGIEHGLSVIRLNDKPPTTADFGFAGIGRSSPNQRVAGGLSEQQEVWSGDAHGYMRRGERSGAGQESPMCVHPANNQRLSRASAESTA